MRGSSGLISSIAAACLLAAGLTACSPRGGGGVPPATTAAVASSSPAATGASSTVAPPVSHPPTARPSTSSPPASPPAIPPVSAQAAAAGFVDVRTVVPDAIIDLRYATTHNFVGIRLYPADARCLVHSSMAAGLRQAAGELRRDGYLLVFWDCYRPHDVQVRMYQVVSDPNWVARPGPYSRSHETGRSVDVTLATAGTRCSAAMLDHGHCLIDMGTGFDDFTARAHAFATEGLSADELANRATLRAAMNSGGLQVYSGEWWHFNSPGASVERPIENAPVD